MEIAVINYVILSFLISIILLIIYALTVLFYIRKEIKKDQKIINELKRKNNEFK